MSGRVLVSIVTYNSAPFLPACLESVKSQSHPNLSVRIWDNDSKDGTREIIEGSLSCIESVSFSPKNVGFCAGHNHLIGSVPSEYVLVLNPDVVLEVDFLKILLEAMDSNPKVGSATGKLRRNGAGAAVLDTTGIYFTRNQRHLDRGSGERDLGDYETREYVFGPSGAAALYRRAMLEELKVGSEYFDESFFAYREDADLAWRAQWMGWHCLYVPQALASHVRAVLPERRAELDAAVNMHSFKNRFLLRVKNMDSGTYLRFFVPITLRDAAALLYVLVRERSSLGAIPLFFRALPKALEFRRMLRQRRRVSPREMRAWFANSPVSKPVEDSSQFAVRSSQ
jgi:GT2 family glycosyltransferase